MGFPIVVVPKSKKPDEIRICVDMRMPNKANKRTRHIMPTVDDILMRLNEATVFSKLDLNSGYHQLELDERQGTSQRSPHMSVCDLTSV